MNEIERLSLKILASDKVALRRLAQQEGEAMSVLVRRILRKEFQRRGLLTINEKESEIFDNPLKENFFQKGGDKA